MKYETAITSKKEKLEKILPAIKNYTIGRRIPIGKHTFVATEARIDKFNGYDYRIYLYIQIHFPRTKGRTKTARKEYLQTFLKYFSLKDSDIRLVVGYRPSSI